MTLNKEFVPYQEALALKVLGFDEPCFGYFNVTKYLGIGSFVFKKCDKYTIDSYGNHVLLRPTYSAAFRWFRDKHGLYYHIVPEFYTNGINFNWQIFWYLPKEEWTHYVISTGTMMYGDNGEYPTQEEAELACLQKLIEIVKGGEK